MAAGVTWGWEGYGYLFRLMLLQATIECLGFVERNLKASLDVRKEKVDSGKVKGGTPPRDKA